MATVLPATLAAVPLAAAVDLTGRSRFVHWGVLQISVANLVVVLLMLAVFVLALVLPFPGGRSKR